MRRSVATAALLALSMVALPAGGAPDVAPGEIARLIAAGDYTAAESAARGLLQEAESTSGAASTSVADAIDLLVEARWRGGHAGSPDSRRLAERAVAIREQTNGRDSLEAATSVYNLATLLETEGDLAAARTDYERALAIREARLGPDDPEVARSLNGLSRVLSDMGDLQGARALCERALAVREKALGTDHPDVGSTLMNLGSITRLMGDYARARSFYDRALAIAEKTTGPESLDAAAAEAAHWRALAI